MICGTTGSGKTRLLQALAEAGAQVLDLEALANHRSSVLGAIPGVAQPTQKRFDTLVWDALRRLDPTRPVFMESESKKVGNVAVPTALIEAMRASPCLNLVLPDAERVALLMEDYSFFVSDVESFLRASAGIDRVQGQGAGGGLASARCALATSPRWCRTCSRSTTTRSICSRCSAIFCVFQMQK